MERAARALYQCAGHGRTHMRSAALAQICVAGPRATKRNHVSHAPSTAQGRAVIARARVCKIALARGPRALAERLPRNADSRAAKRIALVRRAVIILAAALGTKSIAQPLPRGAKHAPISSCTARLVVASCAASATLAVGGAHTNAFNVAQLLQALVKLVCSRLAANMCAQSGKPTLRHRGANRSREGRAPRVQIAAHGRRPASASATLAFAVQTSCAARAAPAIARASP